MSSILELPAVRRRVAPISVETYHALSEQGLIGERTELLRGVIVEKMTKSPLHVTVVDTLYELLRAACRPELLVRKENPLTLTDSEPEPDLAIVAGNLGDFRNSHPRTARLVAEVVVSSEEVDREKAAMYAEAEVEEFWLVLPAAGRVEIFSRPVSGIYTDKRIVQRGEALTTELLPALKVQIDVVFD